MPLCRETHVKPIKTWLISLIWTTRLLWWKRSNKTFVLFTWRFLTSFQNSPYTASFMDHVLTLLIFIIYTSLYANMSHLPMSNMLNNKYVLIKQSTFHCLIYTQVLYIYTYTYFNWRKALWPAKGIGNWFLLKIIVSPLGATR